MSAAVYSAGALAAMVLALGLRSPTYAAFVGAFAGYLICRAVQED